MTNRTAAQMYVNPDDLVFVVAKDKEAEIWHLTISRGPRHNHPFALLLSSNEKTKFSKEGVLEAIESNLKLVQKFGEEMFASEKYGILKAVCFNGHNTKEEYVGKCAPVLEESDISRIMEELKKNVDSGRSECSTYEWDWTARYPKKAS